MLVPDYTQAFALSCHAPFCYWWEGESVILIAILIRTDSWTMRRELLLMRSAAFEP